jgi:hypothetical protein
MRFLRIREPEEGRCPGTDSLKHKEWAHAMHSSRSEQAPAECRNGADYGIDLHLCVLHGVRWHDLATSLWHTMSYKAASKCLDSTGACLMMTTTSLMERQHQPPIHMAAHLSMTPQSRHAKLRPYIHQHLGGAESPAQTPYLASPVLLTPTNAYVVMRRIPAMQESRKSVLSLSSSPLHSGSVSHGQCVSWPQHAR